MLRIWTKFTNKSKLKQAELNGSFEKTTFLFHVCLHKNSLHRYSKPEYNKKPKPTKPNLELLVAKEAKTHGFHVSSLSFFFCSSMVNYTITNYEKYYKTILQPVILHALWGFTSDCIILSRPMRSMHDGTFCVMPNISCTFFSINLQLRPTGVKALMNP